MCEDAPTHTHTGTHTILHSKRCTFAESVFLNLYDHHLANLCFGVCLFSLPSNKGDSFLFVAAVNMTNNRWTVVCAFSGKLDEIPERQHEGVFMYTFRNHQSSFWIQVIIVDFS